MKINIRSEKNYTITMDDKTCALLLEVLKYADLYIIELPVDVVKQNELYLKNLRLFIKEFNDRVAEENMLA